MMCFVMTILIQIHEINFFLRIKIIIIIRSV